jgi:hypothetical protein
LKRKIFSIDLKRKTNGREKNVYLFQRKGGYIEGAK